MMLSFSPLRFTFTGREFLSIIRFNSSVVAVRFSTRHSAYTSSLVFPSMPSPKWLRLLKYPWMKMSTYFVNSSLMMKFSASFPVFLSRSGLSRIVPPVYPSKSLEKSFFTSRNARSIIFALALRTIAVLNSMPRFCRIVGGSCPSVFADLRNPRPPMSCVRNSRPLSE